MSPTKLLCLSLAIAGLLAGCAKPPPKQAELTTQAISVPAVSTTSGQPLPPPLDSTKISTSLLAGGLAAAAHNDHDALTTASLGTAIGSTTLMGRTLRIGSIADLDTLRPGEVILTFDDGPDPSVTPKILATLKDYGVKATFFMVGKMATAHPETAQLVASAGHTVGSHSHGHENFVSIGLAAAETSVALADDELSTVLKPSGKKLAPFFRFPYLAETRALRADLIDSGLVVFGVDVDSWDYLKQSGDQILKRTLKRLDARGKGIVLFHDIHARTARLLPAFLDALQERGYKVVKAVPRSRSIFDFGTLIASR